MFNINVLEITNNNFRDVFGREMVEACLAWVKETWDGDVDYIDYNNLELPDFVQWYEFDDWDEDVDVESYSANLWEAVNEGTVKMYRLSQAAMWDAMILYIPKGTKEQYINSKPIRKGKVLAVYSMVINCKQAKQIMNDYEKLKPQGHYSTI